MTLVQTCPSCGAKLHRDDVPWCVQCYASLVPEPEPEPEVAMDGGGEPGDLVERAESATSPTQPEEVAQLADAMLAELARSDQAPTQWWTRITTTRRTAMLWALAGASAAVVALIAILALLGRFV